MNDDLKISTHSILQKTAINMLKENMDLKFISSVIGFSLDELLILKNKV